MKTKIEILESKRLLIKVRFNGVEWIPLKQAELAMQEYAELFHKEQLPKELKLFNGWMCGNQYDGRIPLIDECIKDFLTHKTK